jgi:hypothetical protein
MAVLPMQTRQAALGVGSGMPAMAQASAPAVGGGQLGCGNQMGQQPGSLGCGGGAAPGQQPIGGQTSAGTGQADPNSCGSACGGGMTPDQGGGGFTGGQTAGGPPLTTLPNKIGSANKLETRPGYGTTMPTVPAPTSVTPVNQPAVMPTSPQTRGNNSDPWSQPGGGFQDPAAGGGGPMPGWSPTGGGGAAPGAGTRTAISSGPGNAAPLTSGASAAAGNTNGNPLTRGNVPAMDAADFANFQAAGGNGNLALRDQIAKQNYGGDQNAMNQAYNSASYGMGGQLAQHQNDDRPWIVQRLAQIQANNAARGMH